MLNTLGYGKSELEGTLGHPNYGRLLQISVQYNMAIHILPQFHWVFLCSKHILLI